MVEQGRFRNDSFDETPIADVPYLRELAQNYRDNPDYTPKLFFQDALLGYYDAMWDALTGTAGHIIYRLSDAIEKPQRETMRIYPKSTGSILIEDKKMVEGAGIRWDSLEDWRNQWERLHSVIPKFTKQLPEGISLKKPQDLS